MTQQPHERNNQQEDGGLNEISPKSSLQKFKILTSRLLAVSREALNEQEKKFTSKKENKTDL